MTLRNLQPFQTIDSSETSFEVTIDSTSVATLLESTAVNRYWKSGPGSRSIRLATKTADDYYFQVGSSLVVAASSDSTLLLGGTVEIFNQIKPSNTYIALQSSTDVTINVTLGYGQ